MRLCVWLLGFAFLSILMISCSSNSSKTSENETLRALIFSQNKLYVVGRIHDYEFNNEQQVADFQKFLQSPFAKRISKAEADITIVENSEDENNIHGWYEIEFDPNKLTTAERHTLVNDFAFHDTTYRFEVPVLVRKYASEGKLVKLTNRNEILQKSSLPTPLNVKVDYVTHSTSAQSGTDKIMNKLAEPIFKWIYDHAPNPYDDD